MHGFNGMKKDELVEECKKRNLDSSGKVADLKTRLKMSLEKENSIEDLFKKYERSKSKDELL